MHTPAGWISRVAIAIACALATPAGFQSGDKGPLSPEQALTGFELEPGYRIELVAAEPLIRNPVAMAFDERGRLFVVENRGYPDPLDGAPATREGSIAVLEDADRDGRFERRTDFVDGLTYPNGIMPWAGGVFVTSAPELLYFRDTDGDGVADQRRVVLTGFEATKTAQIRFSHPTLGIDNWIYLTGGLNGGRVTVADDPQRAPVIFTNSDSRFHPITRAFERTGGQGQFGLTFDDYGRRFICSNRHPVRHVVLEPAHLQRNPHLAFSETMQDVSAVGAEAAVWPISVDMTTASFIPSLFSAPHAGTFTAASGVHIHRGDALHDEHEGSIFVCESAQNLVQRQVRSAKGVTFSSRPARAGREFLATRDPWFRPVFATNGPDGALYIVDMYRKVIDHPQYVPEASRALLDFQAGKEHGRIYRVVARDWKGERGPFDLGRMPLRDLARLFEHRNAWWRETAQRLFVERGEADAIPIVRPLVAGGRTGTARIHALWTLDGLHALQPGDIVHALADGDAGVRENAVRLAAERLGSSAELLTRVLRLAEDADARVRFLVALALGQTSDPRAVVALAAIARRDGADDWVRAAILSSIGGRANEFLAALTALPPPAAARAAVMQDLGRIFGAGETPERCLALVVHVTQSKPHEDWQPSALAGIASGLRSRGFARDGQSALIALLEGDSAPAPLARRLVAEVLERSAAVAADGTMASDSRLLAISLLSHTDYATAGRTLRGLLGAQHSSEIQLAAVRALAQLPGRDGAAELVAAERWAAFTPQVREAVLAALTSEERHLTVLLDALDSEALAVTALSPSRRARLTTHRNADIQKRARARFAALSSGDRMQVYERLRVAVETQQGSAARGAPVFEKRCATCHSFDGSGGRLGPDLSGVGNQPADAILLHTIVPDYEISPGYEAYVVATRDGRTLAGRLQSETASSVTLTDASSQQHVVLRTHILSMSASTSSLMPNELEAGLSDRDVGDLVAYLKRAR